MRTICLPAVLAAAMLYQITLPARADWQLAIDETLERRCFGAEEDRAMRERLIYAARFAACPRFPPIAEKWQLATMPLDGVRLSDASAECVAYVERSWRRMVALARFDGVAALAAFCDVAREWRDLPSAERR